MEELFGGNFKEVTSWVKMIKFCRIQHVESDLEYSRIVISMTREADNA